MPKILTLSDVNTILFKIAYLRDVEQNQFLSHITEIIHTQVDIYFTGFYLLEFEGKWIVFCTGTPGEITEIMSKRGHQFKANAIAANKITLLNSNRLTYTLSTNPNDNLSVKLETDHGPNYLSPLLPETRSNLSLPLRIQEKLIGLWQIESSKENAFEIDDIIHFQFLADQISVQLNLLSE